MKQMVWKDFSKYKYFNINILAYNDFMSPSENKLPMNSPPVRNRDNMAPVDSAYSSVTLLKYRNKTYMLDTKSKCGIKIKLSVQFTLLETLQQCFTYTCHRTVQLSYMKRKTRGRPESSSHTMDV